MYTHSLAEHWTQEYEQEESYARILTHELVC